MSDEILLADLALPPRLRRLCAREGWRTLGELRDAVADGVIAQVRHVGPLTVALAKTICAEPERWRRSVHEGRAAHDSAARCSGSPAEQGSEVPYRKPI